MRIAIYILLSVGTMFAQTSQSVTLGGTKVQLVGNEIKVGDTAPLVTLITSDLKEVSVGGKTKDTQILVVVPSIDTPICDLEARTFNTKAASLENVKITVISMDLPFAAKRYCAAHGIDAIRVASDFQDKAFGKAYGVLMGEGALKGIEARAIFIIKDGKVTYKQLVPEIKQVPDFEAVLKAIPEAVKVDTRQYEKGNCRQEYADFMDTGIYNESKCKNTIMQYMGTENYNAKAEFHYAMDKITKRHTK